MTDLIARMALVAEMDNEKYGRLRRAEEHHYRLWLARREKGEGQPHHWTDGQLVAEFFSSRFWPKNTSAEVKDRAIRNFAAEANRIMFGGLVGEYERDGDVNEYAVEQSQQAIDGGGWFLSASLCHRMDAMVRAAGIRVEKTGASLAMPRTVTESRRMAREFMDASGGSRQPEAPELPC